MGHGDRHDTTIAFHFRETDLDAIYRKVIETRFFDLTEPHPPYQENILVNPDTTYRFVVQAGGKRKELRWSSAHVDFWNPPGEWKRVRDLMQEIYRVQATYPEYKALPEPRAGYQ